MFQEVSSIVRGEYGSTASGRREYWRLSLAKENYSFSLSFSRALRFRLDSRIRWETVWRFDMLKGF